jgi:hypothetical protein
MTCCVRVLGIESDGDVRESSGGAGGQALTPSSTVMWVLV